MKYKIFSLVVSSLLFYLPSAFSADDTLFGTEASTYGPKKNSLTFTMYGGSYLFGQRQEIVDFSDWMNSTWNYGIRAGYVFTPNFEFEAFTGFTPTKTATAKESVLTYGGNFVGEETYWNRVTPYLTFGLGGITFSPDDRPQYTRFAINYGGGVKVFLCKNLALAPDVRGLTSFDTTHTALLLALNLTYYAPLTSTAKPEGKEENPKSK